MTEQDVISEIFNAHGAPKDAISVNDEEVQRYEHRVPSSLIEFWSRFGWGHYRDCYFWVCNPAPFDVILKRLFHNDPEFVSSDMTLIAYTAFAYATVWNRNGYAMLIDFEKSTVHAQPSKALTDPATGEHFSKDFLVAWSLKPAFLDDTEWFEMACSKIGRPRAGEIFAYAPLLQLGGSEDLDHIRRVEATVHMDIVAQLERFTLISLTEPEPGAPLGRMRSIRRIGRS